jgi:type II secretory pathway pseudopilin PulG
VGLVAVGIAGAVVLIASVAAVVVPNMRGSRRAANEAATIKYLRMICSAEATYQSTDANGRYGTLEDLAGDNLIKGELATGSLGDYRFRVSVNGSHYEATATPISYGSTGGRSFYMAEDGVIRGGDHKGLPATSKDLPVRPGEIVTDDGDRPGKELPGGLPSSSGSSGASPSGW